jgi:hypothetical protein
MCCSPGSTASSGCRPRASLDRRIFWPARRLRDCGVARGTGRPTARSGRLTAAQGAWATRSGWPPTPRAPGREHGGAVHRASRADGLFRAADYSPFRVRRQDRRHAWILDRIVAPACLAPSAAIIRKRPSIEVGRSSATDRRQPGLFANGSAPCGACRRAPLPAPHLRPGNRRAGFTPNACPRAWSRDAPRRERDPAPLSPSARRPSCIVCAREPAWGPPLRSLSASGRLRGTKGVTAGSRRDARRRSRGGRPPARAPTRES